ncbi:MAG: glycosyltransferase [Arenicella sp.]|nr:glycosyltransferase [Arenicella sp.]
MPSPISIAICTYNRAQQLAICLASIDDFAESLNCDDEVIVIDNNSHDETREVVEKYSSSLPIRYIFEPVQGLATARNAALKACKNSALLFIDDDTSISNSSLNAYRAALAEFPGSSFFGGKILVNWQGLRPGWLRSDAMPLISGLIGHYDRDKEEPEYNINALLPYGANFLVTRKLTESVGEFDPALGVKGAEIGRGEETDYLLRALQQGFSGRYLPDALVYHHFDASRFSTRYLISYGIQKGRAIGLSVSTKGSPAYWSAAKYLLKGWGQLLKGRIDRYYQSMINVGIEIGRGGKPG